MADLSKIKMGTLTYDLKDATGRTLIQSEATTRATADSALDKRVSALEARGRYLSTWNASTGLPGDYPEIPEGASSPYTYTFKAGDYYIVSNVPASGTKYMPDGTSITATKSGETWTWEIGKKETTEAIAVGGQFIYSTSSWTCVATAKDVAWGNITGNLYTQTDLQGKLDSKVSDVAAGTTNGTIKVTKISTNASGVETATDVSVSVTGLASLAYKSSASGTVEGQTISGVKATGTLTASVTGDLGESTASATITTKEDYTPAGTITAAVASADGDFVTAVSNAASAVTITPTTGTVVGGLKAGDVAAAAIDTSKFSGGSFTGATQASYTQGTDTFTQGTQASITDQTTAKFVKKGTKFEYVNTTADPETLVLSYVETTDTDFYTDAVTNRGTFTANTLPTFSQGNDSFTPNIVGTFTAASIGDGFFAAQKLPVVDDTKNVSAWTGYSAAEAAAQTVTVTKADASFSGTTATQLIPSAISYVKPTKGTLGASASLPEGGLTVGDITVQDKNVTVE